MNACKDRSVRISLCVIWRESILSLDTHQMHQTPAPKPVIFQNSLEIRTKSSKSPQSSLEESGRSLTEPLAGNGGGSRSGTNLIAGSAESGRSGTNLTNDLQPSSLLQQVQ